MIADRVVARGFLPDPLLRAAITQSCRSRLRRERHRGIDSLEEMVARMSDGPIAIQTSAANDQHYEVDPAFFGLVLGPRRKWHDERQLDQPIDQDFTAKLPAC